MPNFNFNKVILAGRLSADPELRTLPSGVATTTITIATSGSKNSETQYFDAVAWRSTAELISKYFKKGSSICVEGSLKNRNWTDANGTKHYKTEIDISNVSFVESRSDALKTAEPVVEPPVEKPTPEVGEPPKTKRTRKKVAEPEPQPEPIAEPDVEVEIDMDNLPF